MPALFEFLCRMGDSTLILGHRLSEWCGHAPVLEEDIAMANTALDLIGQTQLWLGYAAEVADDGRSADDLAFLRDATDFRNLLLTELPNGDFGQTMLRKFLFDLWYAAQLAGLTTSSDPRISEIAAKAQKEVFYHLERSTQTVIALGDGTRESHARMQAALNYLWPYVGEMFLSDGIDQVLSDQGIVPEPDSLHAGFHTQLAEVMAAANLTVPESMFSHRGGRNGQMHSEHLGHLLSQMQWMQRAYPGATW